MEKCRHWGQSYHDANNCTACRSYIQKRLRRDKDGYLYVDESEDFGESSSVPFFIMLGIIIGVCIVAFIKRGC